MLAPRRPTMMLNVTEVKLSVTITRNVPRT